MVVDFTAPSGKVISPSKLAHIVLKTNDGKRLKQFYIDFLGAREVFTFGAFSFLTYDDEHHRIAVFEIPDLPKKVRSSCGLEHMAFTFDSLTDLLTAYQQRKAIGIEPIWCVNHLVTTSIYYKDVDGNIIETQVDSMTPDEANAAMITKTFLDNATGIEFDPEDHIRRLEAGESEATLLIRPDGPPPPLPKAFLEN